MTTRRCFIAGLTFFSAHAASVARADSLPLIRIGAALDDETAPLLYGKQSGIFERAGLNAEIEKFNSGSAITAAVIGGSLDAGKVGTIAAITAFARGIPIKVIAPVALWDSAAPDHRAIIVAAASPLRTAKDFVSKTIAVSSLGDLDTLAIETWLEQNGIDSNAVKLVEIPPDAVPAAIDQNRIDGGVQGEPLLSASLRTKRYRVGAVPFNAIGPHWDVAVIIAETGWIERNRAIVDKFVRGIYEANTYVAKHENVADPLIAQFLNLDLATVSHMTHPERALYLVPQNLQPSIDLAAKYNLIPKTFPAATMISQYALKPGQQ